MTVDEGRIMAQNQPPLSQLPVLDSFEIGRHRTTRMNIDRRALMIGSAVGLAAVASTTNAAPRAAVPAPLVHHVFFWLKNPSSEEDRARLIRGLRTLSGIETVKGIHIGVPAKTERRDVVDHSFSVSEILFFDDLAGQRAYQEHPIHKTFVAECSHLWDRVVVYDIAEAVGSAPVAR